MAKGVRCGNFDCTFENKIRELRSEVCLRVGQIWSRICVHPNVDLHLDDKRGTIHPPTELNTTSP